MKKSLWLLPAGLLALYGLSAHAPAGQRSAGDQALWQRAVKTCNGPQYSSGAQPVVNYARGTFKCVEPGTTRR